MRIELPWPPTTGNNLYMGTGKGRHLKNEVRAYWRLLWALWLEQKSPTFDRPVRLAWRVIQPHNNDVDWDNLRKIIMDGLSVPRGTVPAERARFFPRDSMRQIPEEVVRWDGVSAEQAGIVLTIMPIPDNQLAETHPWRKEQAEEMERARGKKQGR